MPTDSDPVLIIRRVFGAAPAALGELFFKSWQDGFKKRVLDQPNDCLPRAGLRALDVSLNWDSGSHLFPRSVLEVHEYRSLDYVLVLASLTKPILHSEWLINYYSRIVPRHAPVS